MYAYLTNENEPTEFLLDTLDYYGITLEEFKEMSDEDLVCLVNKFSNVLDNGKKPNQGHSPKGKTTGYGEFGGGHSEYEGVGDKFKDKGTYSRFFSLDAWAEKNLPFLIVPKASKKEKNAGCEGMEVKPISGNTGDNKYMGVDSTGERKHNTKNNHPTVKSISLMSYLITMTTRPGDTVLDPFMGSGTTGCAAALLRRKFVGVEMDPDYLEIAAARIEHWKNQAAQKKLFKNE